MTTTGRRPVVLIGHDSDGTTLLAIPLVTVVTTLETWVTLTHARNFGEARSVLGAALLVDDWLDGWAERQQEAGLAGTGADEEAFDADEFFGLDGWRVWTPNASELSAEWLREEEPDLAEELLRPAPEVTLGGEDTTPVIRAVDQELLERELRERGYEPRRCQELSGLFLGPPSGDLTVAAAGLGA